MSCCASARWPVAFGSSAVCRVGCRRCICEESAISTSLSEAFTLGHARPSSLPPLLLLSEDERSDSTPEVTDCTPSLIVDPTLDTESDMESVKESVKVAASSAASSEAISFDTGGESVCSSQEKCPHSGALEGACKPSAYSSGWSLKQSCICLNLPTQSIPLGSSSE